ncbi:MAG: hypothetical protein IKN12_07820 [Selenomonadaceae bacterium]|nr:hypothetical protein [Selenomonadaceae bacterium]
MKKKERKEESNKEESNKEESNKEESNKEESNKEESNKEEKRERKLYQKVKSLMSFTIVCDVLSFGFFYPLKIFNFRFKNLQNS